MKKENSQVFKEIYKVCSKCSRKFAVPAETEQVRMFNVINLFCNECLNEIHIFSIFRTHFENVTFTSSQQSNPLS